MDVCFSMGKSSEKIIEMLMKVADNVKFFSYGTIDEMIRDAKLRHLEFDRIVISKIILTNIEKDFSTLNSFIKDYASNTEIVFVVSEGDEVTYIKPFKKYFDAPMYTPVIMVKGTSKGMIDLVQADILTLKTKYYSLDADDSAVESSDNGESESTGDQESEKVSENDTNNGFGFCNGPSSVYGGYKGSSNSNWSSSEREVEENSDLNSNEGSGDLDGELSIGDLGGLHTDTGYLDDFDDAELAAQFGDSKGKKNKGVVVKDEAENLDASDEISEEEKREQYEEKVIETVQKQYERERVISSDLNIDLVVSTGRCRSTQDMIDEALDLYRKDEAKVLIIDLDTKGNRVLSLLHMGRYYGNNCQEGITKQRVYTEDNIGVCSNGFGVPVYTKDLKALLASKLVRRFDLILIDCPVECLGIFDEELIRMCHVLVFSGGSLEDMSEMTLGLTDRSVVKLEVEKYIMRNCEVEIKGSLRDEDVNFLQDNCLFANGSWLDKIER